MPGYSKAVKRLGVCKHCFCQVGRNADKVLVHIANMHVTCNGKSDSPKAELRK